MGLFELALFLFLFILLELAHYVLGASFLVQDLAQVLAEIVLDNLVLKQPNLLFLLLLHGIILIINAPPHLLTTLYLRSKLYQRLSV